LVDSLEALATIDRGRGSRCDGGSQL